MATSQSFWGLLEYKQQWFLTLKGWIILVLFLVALWLAIITQIEPFLAVSAPVKADILVLEGWVGDGVIKGAISEFYKGNYKLIITTGMPLERGSYLSEYKTYPELTAATLLALGINPDQIVAVPAQPVKINRTEASAKALKIWLAQSNLNIPALNLYSADVHTRRSWIIFKQVLNPEITVGAIANPPLNYDPQSWWNSSEGVRQVISETIAYIYAIFR
jgi:hypothetical protein